MLTTVLSWLVLQNFLEFVSVNLASLFERFWLESVIFLKRFKEKKRLGSPTGPTRVTNWPR
jgi:hypothetical protein